MSVAEARPQIRALSAWACRSLPAQPPGPGLLQVIYFSPPVSLFLMHVLEFLITSKELIWDSLCPCWRVSRGLAGWAGPCRALCSGAGGCLWSPSNGGAFDLPTTIHKEPDTEERAVFFPFALHIAKVPSVTSEPALGLPDHILPRHSGSSHNSGVSILPLVHWAVGMEWLLMGSWVFLPSSSKHQVGLVPWCMGWTQEHSVARRSAAKSPRRVERSSTCSWDHGLCLGHCTA